MILVRFCADLQLTVRVAVAVLEGEYTDEIDCEPSHRHQEQSVMVDLRRLECSLEEKLK